MAEKEINEQKIKETVLNYIEGWYGMNAGRMRKALHPDLVKRRPNPEKNDKPVGLEEMNTEVLLKYTQDAAIERKAPKQSEIKINILDIHKDIALVKSAVPDFIDYIQLAQIKGEWKIVNVLWQF